jgi:hypothetical protein
VCVCVEQNERFNGVCAVCVCVYVCVCVSV